MGLEKSRHDVQISRATIIVDLRPDEDALLASFKPKCRYNIRLAQRHGVTVAPVPLDDESIDTMYSLMASTRDRAGFTLRSKEYFSQYWHLHAAAGQGQLFFASLDGEVLAGVFATYLGRKAWYKDGGSTKEHAAVMAPHLLQWEVMRWLRARGVEAYDLVAVPPAAELKPSHPLYGLYRFKSGFSERITEYVGTWDLPIRRSRYAAWNAFAERAAHQWAYRVRHDLLYLAPDPLHDHLGQLFGVVVGGDLRRRDVGEDVVDRLEVAWSRSKPTRVTPPQLPTAAAAGPRCC